MKKGIFILLFIVLYLSSFPQNSLKNQNNTLFRFIYPISISHISNMEFSEVKRSQYSKMYEIRSTFMILHLDCQREFNYNITFPSSIVLNQIDGEEKIVLILIKNNMSSGDLIIGDMGKEIIKVGGSYIMTPTTATGFYQKAFEIRVNFQ